MQHLYDAWQYFHCYAALRFLRVQRCEGLYEIYLEYLFGVYFA